MTSSIRAWRPSLQTQGWAGLTVPYSGNQQMTRSLYESILEDRLREWVDKNPKRVKEFLTDDPEGTPNLYEIGLDGNPKDWPVQILACDQMQTLLAQINWHEGRTLLLSPSELPSLEETLNNLAQ